MKCLIEVKMSWNDGISKEMNDYLNSFYNIGDLALDEFKAVIKDAVNDYFINVQKWTPRKTSELVQSLVVEEIKDQYKFYGFNVYFKGENSEGQSYQKIANVLNYGRAAGVSSTGRAYPAIAGRYFISNAIKRLRGLDKRIEIAIDKKLSEVT